MNIIDLIGKTPLLKVSDDYNIFAKAEFLNPGGSIKDRVAKNMIEQAEKEGKLKPGMTIIEPTSGNTGIGLALVGVRKGYKVIIVMPENMSEERKRIIRCLGAGLELTPKELSLDGAVKKAQELAAELGESAFIPQQFVNPNNPAIHYQTTAVELWEQMDGKIDIFVSGLGSGGTLQGIGKFLKEKNPHVKVVAVEPKDVSALLGHEPGLHQIQGILELYVVFVYGLFIHICLYFSRVVTLFSISSVSILSLSNQCISSSCLNQVICFFAYTLVFFFNRSFAVCKSHSPSMYLNISL